MDATQNPKFRRHTLFLSKNPAYIDFPMRRWDFSRAPRLAYNQPLGYRFLVA